MLTEYSTLAKNIRTSTCIASSEKNEFFDSLQEARHEHVKILRSRFVNG